MEALNIVQGKQVSHDYPYGSLRCTMTFDIEFKPSKGYRYVTQSINPKTGRLNAPKASTYNHFEVLHIDSLGHIKPWAINIRGLKDIQTLIEFITLHADKLEFTPEQSTWLWAILMQTTKISLYYGNRELKEGKTLPDLKEAVKFSAMIKGFTDNLNFKEVINLGFDLEAFKGLVTSTVY